MIRHLVAAALSSCVLLGLAGCGENETSPLAPTSDLRAGLVPAASADSRERFEVRFLTNMIDHHQEAIDMASLCEGRTVHSELAALCDAMILSQTAEIATMQGMLQTWYGIDYMPAHSDHDRLAALTGEEFEEAFLNQMIRHHTRAVRSTRQCVARAIHPQLITLCVSIAQEQTGEIGQMKSWLCLWYSDCN
jgi:uncharacterized protein (DUF305 family)